MDTVPAKTILSPYKENSLWFGANYTMNIYRGCGHGCIYCDSRSECYENGDFDKIRVKENALGILERELRSKYKKGVVAAGSMSDPYNGLEESLGLTRGALEILAEHRFGVTAATKSGLVTRDIDVFQKIMERAPSLVKITITTADDGLAGLIEPNASAPSLRLAAVKRLSEAGIPVCVLLMPVLPFITDNKENILGVIESAHENGAKYIYAYMGVTLRDSQKLRFFEELDRRLPEIRARYEKNYGPKCYEHRSAHAAGLYEFFRDECRRRGIPTDMDRIINDYRGGYDKDFQLSFLD